MHTYLKIAPSKWQVGYYLKMRGGDPEWVAVRTYGDETAAARVASMLNGGSAFPIGMNACDA